MLSSDYPSSRSNDKVAHQSADRRSSRGRVQSRRHRRSANVSADLTVEYLESLITELRKLPSETGWVELKVSMARPDDIGEYISALSNTAALHGNSHAYVVWGIEDGTHNAVGTRFHPYSEKVGNEALESWLTRSVSPRLLFRFFSFEYRQVPVVLLEIPCAMGRPTQFKGVEYIRVGSYRQALKDHPQIEAQLWRVFDVTPFERIVASERVTSDDVLSLLDYPAYFELMNVPLPSDRQGILGRLADDHLIAANRANGWDVTNLGAILFAKSLEQFPSIARKAVRVIVYQGPGRLVSESEYVGQRGYAAGFR
jgi:ATP-dependent DNA helicase RecG